MVPSTKAESENIERSRFKNELCMFMSGDEEGRGI